MIIQKSNLAFPEEIYEKYLRVIGKIQFTPREVDVIACLMSGKTPQVIANFLSAINKIELQTVNTHIQNIRRKIDGNTRGSIIEFIEKSDKHKIVHQYYLNLLIQKEFYEILNELAILLKVEIENFTIVSYSKDPNVLSDKEYDFNKTALINNLQNYLKLLTNNVTVDHKQYYTSIPVLSPPISDKHYKIYIIEQSECTTDQIEVKESNKKILKNPNSQNQTILNVLLIFFGSEKNNQNTTATKTFNYIDNSTQENHYCLFLEILKMFFPRYRNETEQVLAKFKQRCSSITIPEITSSPNILQKSKSFYEKINSWIILKSISYRYIYPAFIIILCFYFSMLSIYTDPKLNNKNLKNSGNTTSTNALKYNMETNIISPWNTPYLPGYFVKRTELRDKILAKLQNDNQKLRPVILVGLHGLGGVGKTYLALDMINNPIKIYSFRGWITSNDEDKLKADYFKLGNELGLLKNDMNEEQKISIVKNWLNNQKNLLLVFDNVPNMEIVEKYLPLRGDVIITSRNYKIPSAIEVDGMEESESLELLKNLISNSQCHDKCTTLVKKLGYLPLAISQAGAYIAQNQITIDKYLQIYAEEQAFLLLSNVMPVSDRHLPIYFTWNLSLKEIKDNDKTGKAINLLNILAFCHFVDIPKSFLIEYLYGVVDTKTEIEFNEITAFLRQYSLLKITPDTIAIHHLVQDCIRSTMNLQEQKIVLKKAIDTIKKIYPLENKKSNDYELVKILLPQIENLYFYTKKHFKHIDTVQLVICISDAYLKLGGYNKSKELLEEALAIKEKHHSTSKHKEIISALSLLGQAYSRLGNYKKAIVLLNEVLISQIKYYGNRHHVEIAFTLRCLGESYLRLGNYNKSKTLLDEALDLQETYYGSHHHVEIAYTLRRLGEAYLRLGDYKKAKELLEEALVFEENYYGTRKHIEISFTLRYLGQAYSKLGHYDKALPLLKEALTLQESYYCSRQHIEVAYTLRRLGEAYLRLEDYKKAKELLEEALIFEENYYGTRKHIDTLFIIRDLGETYLASDNNKEIELLEEALASQEDFYRTHKHIEIAFTLHYLGQAHLRLGNYKKARELLQEAMAFQESYYGPNHPEVANTLISLAQLENITHNDNYALSLVERANNILQNYPGLNLEHNYIKRAKNLKLKISNSQNL